LQNWFHYRGTPGKWQGAKQRAGRPKKKSKEESNEISIDFMLFQREIVLSNKNATYYSDIYGNREK
jgi:hypothetical protein